jgi:uncharacterized protein (TIGR02118 family)
MPIAWFITVHNPDDATLRASAEDLARFREIVRRTPGLERGIVFTPERARDPYLETAVPPQLAAELYFGDIAALEAAAAADGHLQQLAALATLPSLAGVPTRQQAMLVRRFAVPEADMPAPAPCCSYLVGYRGPAEDLNRWLSHYIEHHPPLMARFPGIREIEVSTRIDWYGFLPWPHETCMLRNRVVFDSAAALAAALASPVRHEMRADYANFPPFSGEVFHYPMATQVISP